MSVREWTFVLVGLSFLLYIGVAVWARAGTTRDFYVAGGQVPAAVNGMATAADWMSAASFISMAGLISFMGRDGAVYLMGWTGGYVLLALLLAPVSEEDIVYFKFLRPDLNQSEHWLLGISPEGIGIVGMLLNFATTFVVSRFTPAPPSHIRERVQGIRVPR